MARITSFMICESITNIQTPQGDNIPQLTAPLSILRPPYIPGSFSFGISVGVSGILLTINNIIKLTIISPGGKEVYNSGNIGIGPFPEDGSIPFESQGFVISSDIRNMSLPEEGAYEVRIDVNDEIAGKQSFSVYKRGES